MLIILGASARADMPRECLAQVEQEYRERLEGMQRMKCREDRGPGVLATCRMMIEGSINAHKSQTPQEWGESYAEGMFNKNGKIARPIAPELEETTEKGMVGQACILRTIQSGWRPGKGATATGGGRGASSAGGPEPGAPGKQIDSQAGRCMKANAEGGDSYGGFTNTCSVAVSYIACFHGVQKDSTDTWAFHCDRKEGLWVTKTGVGELGAGKTEKRGLPVGGRIHIFECREPFGVSDARWDGSRIQAKCIKGR